MNVEKDPPPAEGQLVFSGRTICLLACGPRLSTQHLLTDEAGSGWAPSNPCQDWQIHWAGWGQADRRGGFDSKLQLHVKLTQGPQRANWRWQRCGCGCGWSGFGREASLTRDWAWLCSVAGGHFWPTDWLTLHCNLAKRGQISKAGLITWWLGTLWEEEMWKLKGYHLKSMRPHWNVF